MQGDATPCGLRGKALFEVGEERGDFDFDGGFQFALLFELGESQQPVDQRLQAFALGAHVAGKALALGFRQSGLFEQFGGAADGGERAFHFVREVLHVVFDVGAAINLVAQVRQGAREFADFVAPARGRFGGLAGRERTGVAHEPAHRHGQPGGEGAAEEQRGAEQHQPLPAHRVFAARDDRRQSA